MNKQRALVVVRGAVKSLTASSKKSKDADAQRAIQKISACLAILEGPELEQSRKQDVFTALRASMQPLYKFDIKAAVALCVALFDYILNRRIMPLRENPSGPSEIEHWEALLKQLMDGIIDFLEDNPSKAFQTSFSASLYPALHDFYFRRAHMLFSNVRLSNTILDVILETVRDHPENQKKLRDDDIFGGKVLGTLIYDVKHFLILENLLKLLGNLKPESTTKAGLEQATKFVKGVFDPNHFSRHEELAKIILSATASTWETNLLEIVDILADMRADCPQPFRMTSFEAKLTESAVFSDRIYVDYDSFLISYETDEQEDIFLIPFKNIHGVKKATEASNATTLISIQYGSAEQSPGTLIGDGTASFKLQSKDVTRFFERLKERNIALPSRKQSRLKSPIPLNFDASGKSLMEKMDEFVLSRPSSPEIDEDRKIATPMKAIPITAAVGSPSPAFKPRRTTGGRIVSDDDDDDDDDDIKQSPKISLARTDNFKTDVVVNSELALQTLTSTPSNHNLKRNHSNELLEGAQSPKRRKLSLDLSQPPTSPLKRKLTLAIKHVTKPPEKKYGRLIRSSSVVKNGDSDLSEIEEDKVPPPEPTKRVTAGMKGKDIAKKGGAAKASDATKAKDAGEAKANATDLKKKKKVNKGKAESALQVEDVLERENKPKPKAKPKVKASTKDKNALVDEEKNSRRSARVAKHADLNENESQKQESDKVVYPTVSKRHKKNPHKSNHMPWNDLARSEVSTKVDDVPAAVPETEMEIVFESSEPVAEQAYVDTYEALKGLNSTSDPVPPSGEDVTMVDSAPITSLTSLAEVDAKMKSADPDVDIMMEPSKESDALSDLKSKNMRSKPEKKPLSKLQEMPTPASVKRTVERSRISTGETDTTMVDASSMVTPAKRRASKGVGNTLNPTESASEFPTEIPHEDSATLTSTLQAKAASTYKPANPHRRGDVPHAKRHKLSDMLPVAPRLMSKESVFEFALATPVHDRSASKVLPVVSLPAASKNTGPLASSTASVMKTASPVLFTPRHIDDQPLATRQNDPKTTLKPRTIPISGSRLRREISRDGPLFETDRNQLRAMPPPLQSTLVHRSRYEQVQAKQERPSTSRKPRPTVSMESDESTSRTTTERIIETLNEINGFVVKLQVDRIEQPRLAVRMGRNQLLQHVGESIEEMSKQYRGFYEEAVTMQGRYEAVCTKNADGLVDVVTANRNVSEHLNEVIRRHDKTCLSGSFTKTILPIPAILSRKNVF